VEKAVHPCIIHNILTHPPTIELEVSGAPANHPVAAELGFGSIAAVVHPCSSASIRSKRDAPGLPLHRDVRVADAGVSTMLHALVNLRTNLLPPLPC
jgi:hypothetical protein